VLPKHGQVWVDVILDHDTQHFVLTGDKGVPAPGERPDSLQSAFTAMTKTCDECVWRAVAVSAATTAVIVSPGARATTSNYLVESR